MATIAGRAHEAAGTSVESRVAAREASRPTAIAAAAMAGLAAVAFLAGLVTPVPGGGFCTGSCAAYPFDDPALVRDFVPVSFYWMYPAIGMLLAQVIFTASLATTGRAAARLPAVLGFAFTLLGAGVLLGDYAIQLAVVAPSLLHGEGAAIVGFSLFNPHGVFVALEDVGYWALGISFLGVAAELGAATRAERLARDVFRIGGIVAVGALPALVAILGPDLGFAYEILVITVVDLVLFVGGVGVALGLTRSADGTMQAGGAAQPRPCALTRPRYPAARVSAPGSAPPSRVGQAEGVVDEAVQRAYAQVRERVWNAEEGDDDDAALARLTPLERALYVTRILEEELADGGWYLVFANEDDHLVPLAVEAYELLGLPEYARHFRGVLDAGFGDESGEDEGDRLDREYAALSGAEAARARALASDEPGSKRS